MCLSNAGAVVNAVSVAVVDDNNLLFSPRSLNGYVGSIPLANSLFYKV